MSAHTTRRVTAAEINELLDFERRLRHRGKNATCAEWVAYFEAKADLFDRIASDPLSMADAATCREMAATSREQAELARTEVADWRWS